MKPVKNPILYEDITYKVIGCAQRIHSELGQGHKESVYQKALAIEFENENILYKKEPSLTVTYGKKSVGIYRPDFLVDKQVIIETKAIHFIPRNAVSQLDYYLKNTKCKVGLLLNFGSNSLQVKRRIHG